MSAVRLGAIAWLFAIQFFVTQLVVQAAWTTPFSLAHNFISDLGNTACAPYPAGSDKYVCSPWHTWMNASFIALGLSILVGAVLVRPALPSGFTRAAGLVLLALAGLGLVLVGLFPENENIGLHTLGAGTQFVCGNLGLIVLGIAMLGARWPPALTAFTIASGAIGLLATGLFQLGHYLGLGIGGMERVAVYPLPIWLMVTGGYLLRSAKL
jgi:hypothetical membrane protein